MNSWWTADKLMMNWWWTDDELMMNCWWTDDELMMNWWWTDLVCQRLPQTTTDYHRLSQTTTDYHRLPQITTDCHWLIGCTPLNTQTYLRDGPSILLHISLTPPTTRAPLAVLKTPCMYYMANVNLLDLIEVDGWIGWGRMTETSRSRMVMGAGESEIV